MKRTKRNRIIIFSLILGVLLISFLFLIFFSNEINLKGTLSTEYIKTNDPNSQIIETDFFEIETPKNWIHIFGGYGMEGEPYGRFMTGKGMIYYEYGFFAPDYNEDCDIYHYKVDKKQIGRFQVNVARNNENETGIAIPRQNEMNRMLTFYMSESVTNNYQDLKRGIETLKFY